MRVFLAVPSDGMWVESARGLVARLKESLPVASWTKPASWHLTLKFLGDGVTAEQAREFGKSISAEATATVPGEIRSNGAVVFPLRGPARVLGVGFGPADMLEGLGRLAAEAEKEARRLKLSEEKRGFHAHLTFARLRHPWPQGAVETFQDEVARWESPPWHARSVVLYESRLDRDGAVHTPLAEWSFSGGPRGVRA